MEPSRRSGESPRADKLQESPRAQEKPKEINLAKRILQATNEFKNYKIKEKSTSVLRKIELLNTIKNNLSDSKELMDLIYAEKRNLMEGLTQLKKELSDLSHPAWGKQTQKYLDKSAKIDPTKLNTEQTIRVLQQKITAQEQKIQQIDQQIQEIDNSPEGNMLSQSIEDVQKSIELLNKITLGTGNFTIEVPLSNVLESSGALRKHYESGMKGTESNILMLKLDRYLKNDAKAFLQFFKEKAVELTEENVLPLLYLANEFEVEPLHKYCLEFLKGAEEWEDFPALLDTGIELDQKELIWGALKITNNYLRRSDLKSEKFKSLSLSTKTKDILEALSKRELRSSIKFGNDLGVVEIYDAADTSDLKDFSSLNVLEEIIPLTLSIQNPIDNSKDLNSILRECPNIAHLKLTLDLSRDMDLTIEELKKLTKLKTLQLNIKGLHFKSLEELQNLETNLSPIKLDLISISLERINNSDLAKIPENFKNLKRISILHSEIEDINFKNLKYISFSDCKFLNDSIRTGADVAVFNSCKFNKNIEIMDAKDIKIHKPDHQYRFENLKAPNATKLDLNNTFHKSIEVPSSCKVIGG